MKIPKINKELLRQAASVALTDRGFKVAFLNGPGIVRGARLTIEEKGANPKTVAVRTSREREVGLLRQRSGKNWQTISRVDEVVVAVPDAEDAAKIEVLGFEPDLLSAVFDAAAQGRELTANAHKAPFFVSLDRQTKSLAGDTIPSLLSQASWRRHVALQRLVENNPAATNMAAVLIEQFKRDLLSELNASEIRVEITIVK
jgi:hypothetical protein